MNFQNTFIFSLALFSLNIYAADIPDNYPSSLSNKLQAQRINELSAAKKLPGQAAHFLISGKHWDAGQTILVAFNGGNSSLHKAIAEQAAIWEKFANIKFDFGYEAQSGEYRHWSENDTSRVAHIRIGFSASGYWSLIGTDSYNDDLAGLKDPSMNFHNFPQLWPNLMPADWKTIVVHEFGHALGLYHEHQHPSCGKEFRWSTGPNGEPSVYETFAQWQNWDAATVDINLRPITEGQIFTSPIADRSSVMFYAMPAQAFINGVNSPCFIDVENTVISPSDASAAKTIYPKNPSEAANLAFSRTVSAILTTTSRKGDFSDDEKKAVNQQVESSLEARKPLLYIQIQSETDRKLASALQNKAKQQNFIAPGIENVSSKHLKSASIPEVRYFRAQDLAYASQAKEILSTELGTTNIQVRQVKKFENSVTRNLIEIWLPKSAD